MQANNEQNENRKESVKRKFSAQNKNLFTYFCKSKSFDSFLQSVLIFSQSSNDFVGPRSHLQLRNAGDLVAKVSAIKIASTSLLHAHCKKIHLTKKLISFLFEFESFLELHLNSLSGKIANEQIKVLMLI